MWYRYVQRNDANILPTYKQLKRMRWRKIFFQTILKIEQKNNPKNFLNEFVCLITVIYRML